jgi:hypothetical protein
MCINENYMIFSCIVHSHLLNSFLSDLGIPISSNEKLEFLLLSLILLKNSSSVFIVSRYQKGYWDE